MLQNLLGLAIGIAIGIPIGRAVVRLAYALSDRRARRAHQPRTLAEPECDCWDEWDCRDLDGCRYPVPEPEPLTPEELEALQNTPEYRALMAGEISLHGYYDARLRRDLRKAMDRSIEGWRGDT